MKEMELASTGRRTTQLGYGCSSIMGSLSRKESIALLEAAFDAGIRHFDVAPVYGFGAAEGCLGEFLQRHRHKVTVTTKFGIPAARNRWLLEVAKEIVKPLMEAVPPVKKRMTRIANRVAGTGSKVAFTAEMAMKSLHNSLRQLRVERIDLFLMHEAEAANLSDERLLKALRHAQEAGKIGGFGVGSDALKIPDLIRERPAYCRTLQYDWSVLQAETIFAKSFRIHHRSLGEAFRSLNKHLLHSPEVSRRWSEAIGADLSCSGVLGRVMMRAALDRNPKGLLLFSSRSAEHMKANVEIARADTLSEVAGLFYALLQQEVAGFEGNGRSMSVEVSADSAMDIHNRAMTRDFPTTSQM